MVEIKTQISVEEDVILSVHSRSLVNHPALEENFIPLSQDATADLLGEHSPKHKLFSEVRVLQKQLEAKRINLVNAKQEFHNAESKLEEKYHIQEMYEHIADMEKFYHGFRGKLDELCGHFEPDHPELDAMLHWFHGIENALHALGVSELPTQNIHPEWTLENIKKLVEHDTFNVLEAQQEHTGKFAGVSSALDRLMNELSENKDLKDLHAEAQKLRDILDARRKQTTHTEEPLEKTDSLQKELALKEGGVSPESRIKKLLEREKKKKSGMSGENPHAHVFTTPTYN